MSNPLLRPNDPRFQKPDVRDAAGKNRFGEGEESADDSATDEARPFVPRYEAQEQSRGGLLLFLGGVGWGTALAGAVSLGGLFDVGWISPLLGIAPSAAAWLLAIGEWRAIAVGAIDANCGPRVRHAFWLGLTATIACAAIVAAMINRQMNFLPDVL